MQQDWDIEPPEYETPVPDAVVVLKSTTEPAVARGVKPQRRAVDGAYSDKPLLLHVTSSHEIGYIDADTHEFWGAFASASSSTTPQVTAYDIPVMPANVCASHTVMNASFYDFEMHEWFVALCVDAAQEAIVRGWHAVTSVTNELPTASRLCDEAHAVMQSLPCTPLYVWTPNRAATAHVLIFRHGMCVFPGMLITDVSTPVLRAQCTLLHALKQSSMEDDLARCADAVTSSRVVSHAGSLTGMYKLPHVNVTRAALTWGMFAALHMSKQLFLRDGGDGSHAEKPSALFEPLASYAQAVLDVQDARARAIAPCIHMQYSTEQKPSMAQCAHALVLFYWAAVHADPDSAIMSPDTARLNLELYVRYGLLVVRRRAYHFQNGNKKRRKRKNTDAEAQDSDE